MRQIIEILPVHDPSFVPASVRVRDSLDLEADATDDDVRDALRELPTAAACHGCREGQDSRGHSSCSPYHPAWDHAEALGLADADLTRNGWTWAIS